MATATRITRVTYRWDDQYGVEPGWYCVAWDGDTSLYDSQKVWFPVEVDEFGRHLLPALRKALATAFPGATIEAE